MLSLLITHEVRDKLESYYERNKLRLVSIAIKITSSHAMAEDAVHNAFESILKDKKKFLAMSEIDFLNWCVSIVKNKCIDLMRKEKKYADSPYDDFQDILPSASMPVDEHVARKEVYGRLKEGIKLLDETNRQIFMMKYYHRMSMKEIGDEIGLTPEQVNSRLERTRKKLKAFMLNEEVSYV